MILKLKDLKPVTASDKLLDKFTDYLNYSVKEGHIDEDTAQELIDKKDWKAIQYLMDKGDDYEEEN
jgi:hypothetical protein